MTDPLAPARATHLIVAGPRSVPLRTVLVVVLALLTLIGAQTADAAQPAAALHAHAALRVHHSRHPHQRHLYPAQRVIRAARRHLGADYLVGSEGPRMFDCSGLVFRVFQEAGVAKSIGGKRLKAAEYLRWFRVHHRVTRRHGRPGDLVIYDGGSHMGIYLGHGKVISALVSGVRLHGLRKLSLPFTAFLHTRLRGAPPPGSTNPLRMTSRVVPLRTHPDEHARLTRTVRKGTVLRVLHDRHDRRGKQWLHVRLPVGGVGWLRKAFTEVVKPLLVPTP